MRRVRGRGEVLLTNLLLREHARALGDLAGDGDCATDHPKSSPAAKTAECFRRLAIGLILASALVAVALIVALRVRVDPQGTSILECLIAVLLLASRIWWNKIGRERMADACGTVAVVALGGMSCGAIAMVELRLGFPLADGTLRSFDRALGIDGIAVVAALLRQGHWIFWVMAPAYNLTIPIFFVGLVALAWLGDRVEAWRAAFCFVGTLLTTCLVAIFVPAKGLGVWAPPGLLARLPQDAMRTFWPHFDNFYFGADPVLRMQVVDGVISFPSFHAVTGFLVWGMWRTRSGARALASLWLAVMLLATLPGGGHYVIDLVAGLLVWAIWFLLSLRLSRKLASEQ